LTLRKKLSVIPWLLNFGVDRLVLCMLIAKCLINVGNPSHASKIWSYVAEKYEAHNLSYKRVKNMLFYMLRLGAVKRVKLAGKPAYEITEEGRKMYFEWKSKFEKAYEVIIRP